MSYDLIILSENAETMKKQIFDFLSQRPHNTPETSDIMYENEDTDVHFQWIFEPYFQDEEPVHEKEVGHLRLNYNRPTAFAKEAAIELQALSSALPISFFDLQENKIYDKFLSHEQLTKPYTKHAQGAVSALINSNEEYELPQKLPRQALDAIWSWNYNRDQLYDSLNEDLFIPRVSLMQFDGKVQTYVIWGDGVPMLCPNVDLILSARSKTAPKAGFFGRRKDQYDLLTFKEFTTLYANFFTPTDSAPRAVSCKPTDTSKLATAVRLSPLIRAVDAESDKNNWPFTILQFHTILDTEICVPTDSSNVSLRSKTIEDLSDKE